MRHDKKHIAFFMAFGLAVILMVALSGCGKKAEPSPSTSAGMGVSSPSSNVDENKVYAKIIDRYKKALSGDSNESISSMGLNSSIYHVLGQTSKGDYFPLFITGKFCNEFSVHIKKFSRESGIKISKVFCIFCIYSNSQSPA